MPLKLNITEDNFHAELERLVVRRQPEAGGDVAAAVTEILAQVKAQGDSALIEYTRRFDHAIYSSKALRVSAEEIAQARNESAPELIAALELAAERIRNYHRRQMPEDLLYTDDSGVTLGWKWTALAAAGIYVPGGRAVYPSSVLMNAIPARVAGVKRLVMVVPTPSGNMNPALLVAADICGVDEIYKIGGAQAIAALAYGTETITAVDVIVGPGNQYVAEAKRRLFGVVGIDMLAGPSEILVVAGSNNNPRWIAADLLSQAEHAPDAQAILLSDNEDFADKVTTEIENLLETLPRREIAQQSWQEQGAVILVENIMQQAASVINRIAPEHLELAVDNPQELAEKIHNAGAIFLGNMTAEAMGDYVAGPSHVLPTNHTARFTSGLSVFNFLKRSSLISCSAEAVRKLAPTVETLAAAEELSAHALSVRLRREEEEGEG